VSNEERANCPHHEKVEEFHEYALGTCIYCGQVRRYDRLDIRIPPRIVKTGRLNGVEVSVIPNRIKESVEVKQDKPEKTAIFRNIPEVTDMTQDSDPLPVPPRPEVPPGSNLRQKMMLSHDYYESNKDAIIKEWEQLNRPVKLTRWGITQASLTSLLIRWGLIPKPEKKSPQKAEAASSDETLAAGAEKSAPAQTKPNLKYLGTYVVQEDKGMPDFPAFNEEWSDYVKVNWFEAYQALKKLEVKQ